MSNDFNLATIWETVANTVPAAPALRHGDLTIDWATFDDHAARFAQVLGDAGIGHDSKIAHYLYNCPEYLIATFGSFKARAIPVNVNYRYTESELEYLFSNSDAEAVVVDSSLAHNLVGLRDRLPKLKLVIQVGAGELIEGALRFDEALDQVEPAERIERSGDDLWFLYTGGTTGMPKGVMWPHSSLFGTAAATYKGFKRALPESLDEVADAVRQVHAEGRAIVQIPAAPLMHGTSAIAGIGVLCTGGCLVTLTSTSFSAAELLEATQRWGVTNLTIVGDAFAKPILAELAAAKERGVPYDVSSLNLIVSSGVMWSQSVKDEILTYADVALADLLGSSEGVGFANSLAKRGRKAPTAKFKLGPHAQVLTDLGQPVVPGSGERGMLAVGGPIPVGYYKDPEKSAETFRTYGGRVWSVPGDFARVELDGTITLLGRGSACINTAGEKVYPEEVEEVLKEHPRVLDCNVVGVADDKWGQAVCAVVSLVADSSPSDELEVQLREHCRGSLAGYKLPKRIAFVGKIQRGPNGKPDYRWATGVVQQ